MGCNIATRPSLEVAERNVKALELHRDGKSTRAIAKILGVAQSTIHKHVKKTLKAYAEEAKDIGKDYIEQEIERLDQLLETYLPLAREGDTKAFECVQKIMQQRSKYRGFDAPIETNVKLDGEVALVAAMSAGSTRVKELGDDEADS